MVAVECENENHDSACIAYASELRVHPGVGNGSESITDCFVSIGKKRKLLTFSNSFSLASVNLGCKENAMRMGFIT